jgi:hypothetical protein
VKGFRQYWLTFHRGAKALAAGGPPTIVTVCQLNAALVPRLTPGVNRVHYAASHRAVASAGPTLPQARTHRVDGDFESPRLTLALAPPGDRRATAIHAAAHMRSSSPPDPEIAYHIEYSTDGGRQWEPIVRDWKITRRGDEPRDFWSQSFVWGECALPAPTAGAFAGPIQVRFRNTGGKRIARAEVHVVYEVPRRDRCEIVFAIADSQGGDAPVRQVRLEAGPDDDLLSFDAGPRPDVRWVEFRPLP